jgi:hypothetical protein
MNMGAESWKNVLLDQDPPGDAPDPVRRITSAAVELGLIQPGEALDRRVLKLCMQVVDMAAKVGDRFSTSPGSADTVGNHIRAELYD